LRLGDKRGQVIAPGPVTPFREPIVPNVRVSFIQGKSGATSLPYPFLPQLLKLSFHNRFSYGEYVVVRFSDTLR
jgi:hypothetical protein